MKKKQCTKAIVLIGSSGNIAWATQQEEGVTQHLEQLMDNHLLVWDAVQQFLPLYKAGNQIPESFTDVLLLHRCITNSCYSNKNETDIRKLSVGFGNWHFLNMPTDTEWCITKAKAILQVYGRLVCGQSLFS